MIKQTMRDGLLYAFPTILSRGMGIFLIPLYTRYLSPDEYGVLELLQIVYVFLSLTLPLEVSQGMVRYFADVEERQEREKYFSTAFWFTGAAFVVFCTLAVWNADLVIRIVFADTPYGQAVMLAIIAMIANALAYLISNQLRFDMRPLAYATINMVVVATTVLFVLLLVVYKGDGILGYAWSILIAHFAGLAAGLLLCRWGVRLKWFFSAAYLKRMLVFSAPLILSSLAVYANNYIDRWMVLHFLGFDPLGIYSAGFRIATGVFLVLLPLQMAITPIIYSRYTERETPSHLAVLLDVTVLVLACGILLVGSLIPEIFAWLIGEKFRAGAWLVPWLSMSVALMNLYVFAPGMSLSKRTGLIAVINIFVVIVNVTLNYILIPEYQLWGAAISTLVSGCVFLGLYLYVSNRLYPMPYSYVRHLVVLTGMNLTLYGCMINADSLSIRLVMVVLGMIGLLAIYASKIHQFISMLKAGDITVQANNGSR